MSHGSLLSASGSPQGVQPIGVRRLNHLPLYIIGVVAAVVAALLAWVAFDKSKQPPAKSEDHGGNTDSYAAQVVGDKVGYVHAANIAPPVPTPPSAVMTETAVPTPPPSGTNHRPASSFQFAVMIGDEVRYHLCGKL